MTRKLLLIIFLVVLTPIIAIRPSFALSLNDIIRKPQALIIQVTEKLEYVLAFSPAAKVQVLEKQAERRLTEAKDNAQIGNDTAVESSIKDYENLKNQQAPMLDDIEPELVNIVKEKTINQQGSLKGIVDVFPGSETVVTETNKTVVENVKKTIEYAEGTTAGEAFENKALIVYAPGTSAGSESDVTYEGGGQQMWAPGTSGGGEGRVTYEGGEGQVVVGQPDN